MNRPRPFTSVGFLALVIFASTRPVHAQEAPLRWTAKPGETLRYRLELDSTVKTQIQGNAIDAKNGQTFDLNWTVKSVDGDGTAHLVEVVDRVRLKAEGPGGKLEYDSKEEKPVEAAAAPIAKVFSSMIGGEITAVLTPEGEIKDVTLPAKAIDALNEMPAGPGGQKILTQESLKEIVELVTQILPGKSVAKGATWEKTRKNNVPLGSMTATTAYTYEGKDSTETALDRIVQSSKLSLVLKPELEGKLEATIKNQEVKGVVLFDSKAGHVKSSRVDQDVTLDIKASTGQAMEQQTITKVALTKVDAEAK